MTRFWTIWLAGLFLAASLAACGGDLEKKRQEQVQAQIAVLERQLSEMDRSHGALQSETAELNRLIANFNGELVLSQNHLVAARGIHSSLRELIGFGLGESPAHWVVSHPMISPSMMILILLGLLIIWALFRRRQQQLELAINDEINSVVTRLAREGKDKSPLVPPAAKPAPAQPGPKAAPAAAAEPRPAGGEPKPKKSPPAKPLDLDPARAKIEKPPAESKAPKPVIKVPEREPKAEEEKKAVLKPAPPRPKPEPAAVKERARPVEPLKKAGPREGDKTPKAAAGKIEKKEAPRKGARRGPGKKCKVKGCPNKHRSKGFCNKHYQQWRKGILEEEIEE